MRKSEFEIKLRVHYRRKPNKDSSFNGIIKYSEGENEYLNRLDIENWQELNDT